METMELKNMAEKLRADLNSKPNIVCVGLYNHGKSTLLNAIVKDCENKTFGVTDRRETMVNKSVELNDAIYTDTPGLGAQMQDTKIALYGANFADILVMVHSLKEGELNKDEVMYLRNLPKQHLLSFDEISYKLIIVINHIKGENLSEKDIINGTQRISQQLKEIFANEIKIFCIETTSYIKGIRENKQLLAKNSGYFEFEKYLNNMIQNKNFIKFRKIKLNAICNQAINQIQAELKEVCRELEVEDEKMNELSSEIMLTSQTIENMKSRLR